MNQKGFTLLEVAFAFSVIILLILAFLTSITSSQQANANSLESELAYTAAQDLAERIIGTKFPTDTTFGQVLLNNFPDGATYDLTMLSSLEGLPAKVDGNPANATLRYLNESEAAQELGLPNYLDFNDNGVNDATVLTDFNFYLAEVTVTWASRHGLSVDQSQVVDRTIVLPVTIYRKEG